MTAYRLKWVGVMLANIATLAVIVGGIGFLGAVAGRASAPERMEEISERCEGVETEAAFDAAMAELLGQPTWDGIYEDGELESVLGTEGAGVAESPVIGACFFGSGLDRAYGSEDEEETEPSAVAEDVEAQWVAVSHVEGIGDQSGTIRVSGDGELRVDFHSAVQSGSWGTGPGGNMVLSQKGTCSHVIGDLPGSDGGVYVESDTSDGVVGLGVGYITIGGDYGMCSHEIPIEYAITASGAWRAVIYSR